MMQIDLFAKVHKKRVPFSGTTIETLQDAEAIFALRQMHTRYWIGWKDDQGERRVGIWFPTPDGRVFTLSGIPSRGRVKFDDLAFCMDMPREKREATQTEAGAAENSLREILRESKGWIEREGNSPDVWKLIHSGMCN
jgi:hypothetical protein